MTRDRIRQDFEAARSAAEAEATALRNSQSVLEALNAHYRSLGSADRLHAQAVLVEWVLANDEKLRFDALAIIDEFKVVAAVPALLTLANRLKASATPAAPYELEKVRRIIARVRGHSSGD